MPTEDMAVSNEVLLSNGNINEDSIVQGHELVVKGPVFP